MSLFLTMPIFPKCTNIRAVFSPTVPAIMKIPLVACRHSLDQASHPLTLTIPRYRNQWSNVHYPHWSLKNCLILYTEIPKLLCISNTTRYVYTHLLKDPWLEKMTQSMIEVYITSPEPHIASLSYLANDTLSHQLTTNCTTPCTCLFPFHQQKDLSIIFEYIYYNVLTDGQIYISLIHTLIRLYISIP